MKDLSETFLIAEALFDLAAPDFPLMREEWATEDAYAAAEDDYWNKVREKDEEDDWDDWGYLKYLHPELS
jgi:hypothetical protein